MYFYVTLPDTACVMLCPVLLPCHLTVTLTVTGYVTVTVTVIVTVTVTVNPTVNRTLTLALILIAPNCHHVTTPVIWFKVRGRRRVWVRASSYCSKRKATCP